MVTEETVSVGALLQVVTVGTPFLFSLKAKTGTFNNIWVAKGWREEKNSDMSHNERA